MLFISFSFLLNQVALLRYYHTFIIRQPAYKNNITKARQPQSTRTNKDNYRNHKTSVSKDLKSPRRITESNLRGVCSSFEGAKYLKLGLPRLVRTSDGRVIRQPVGRLTLLENITDLHGRVKK